MEVKQEIKQNKNTELLIIDTNKLLSSLYMYTDYYHNNYHQHEEDVQASENAVISPEDLLECVAHECPMLMRQGKYLFQSLI